MPFISDSLGPSRDDAFLLWKEEEGDTCKMGGKMCEDCGQKQANFGRESEMTKRWCSACVKANGHTAVNVCGHKKCEICIVKFASYGTPTEGKRRWCGDCCKRERKPGHRYI